jgi:acetyl-CoA C-acetyltransferase
MAQAAAALADTLGIVRAEADAFAVASHARALDAGPLPEIVSLQGVAGDAFTRRLTPALAARAPVLVGPVTAANAAVAADAAAFVVVAATGQGPRIAAQVTLGADPCQPGLAPIPAIAAALARAGLRPGDLSAAEIMEAYAVQAIACIRGAGLDPAIVNAKGGALARGHPIGASGAILAVRLVHDLTAGQHGLAAIASAGGIGAALVLAAD